MRRAESQARASWCYETARGHRAAQDEQANREAAAVFGAAGPFDPETTRAAPASFEQPVLVVAGEVDLNSPPSAMAEPAGLFPNAEVVVQPGAGHFPWLDDADRFMGATVAFLG